MIHKYTHIGYMTFFLVFLMPETNSGYSGFTKLVSTMATRPKTPTAW